MNTNTKKITKSNKKLAQELETLCKPRGVVGFSNCCRYRCTATYGDDDNFKPTYDGIYFIRIYFGGMNYKKIVRRCFAYYDDFDKLLKNWNDELHFLEKYFAVFGLTKDDYIIKKPRSQLDCVAIEFVIPIEFRSKHQTSV